MNADSFDRQIEAARKRWEALEQSAKASAGEKGLVAESLEELSTAMEELHVAAEELRQQNEELVYSRQLVEVERERYQELFEFAPDGYLLTDPDGMIREANRAAGNLLGVQPEFLVGKPLLLFVSGEAREGFWEGVHRSGRNASIRSGWELPLQPREGPPSRLA